MQNIIEELRQKAVENVLGLKSMQNGWESRRKIIVGAIGNPPTGRRVLDLGDVLADVFRTSATKGRGQGNLSGAGVVWESLVCWYCNLCLIGSRAVVVKTKRDVVPQPLLKAISVQMNNTETASEADLIAIIFPNRPKCTQITGSKQVSLITRLNDLTEEYFGEYGLCIIQCKTNWNDSAQIPMLWDMIYTDAKFSGSRVHVGSNGYSINDLNDFKYAFVTVPTNDFRKYSAGQLNVTRVSGLSGGNYWGHKSVSGIAHSVKQMIGRNFQEAFKGSSLKNLDDQLGYLRTHYGYFDLT